MDLHAVQSSVCFNCLRSPMSFPIPKHCVFMDTTKCRFSVVTARVNCLSSSLPYFESLPSVNRRVSGRKADNSITDTDAEEEEEEEEHRKENGTNGSNNLSMKAEDLFSVTSSSHFEVDYLGESTKGDMNIKRTRFDKALDYKGGLTLEGPIEEIAKAETREAEMLLHELGIPVAMMLHNLEEEYSICAFSHFTKP